MRSRPDAGSDPSGQPARTGCGARPASAQRWPGRATAGPAGPRRLPESCGLGLSGSGAPAPGVGESRSVPRSGSLRPTAVPSGRAGERSPARPAGRPERVVHRWAPRRDPQTRFAATVRVRTAPRPATPGCCSRPCHFGSACGRGHAACRLGGISVATPAVTHAVLGRRVARVHLLLVGHVSAFQHYAESCLPVAEVVDRVVDLVEAERLADGGDVVACGEVEHGECGGRATRR